MGHQGGEMGLWLESRDPSPFLMTSLNVNSKPASEPRGTLESFLSPHLEGLPWVRVVPHCATVLLMAQPATGYISPRTCDAFTTVVIIPHPWHSPRWNLSPRLNMDVVFPIVEALLVGRTMTVCLQWFENEDISCSVSRLE